MKFFTLALLGVAMGQEIMTDFDIEDEVDEMVKVLYRAEDTKAFFTQAKKIEATIKKNAPQMMKRFKMRMARWMKFWESKGPKYLKELEAWG
jgi:hypothetical protein